MTRQFTAEEFMTGIQADLVIETRGLTKRFGSKTVLDDLSLEVPSGRIHALIGANGAGKSTLFRILLGFVSPTEGEALLVGRPAGHLTAADRGRVGFVNEEHSLPEWMTVDAVTAMQRRQYAAWNEGALEEVVGNYNVLPSQKIGQLSRGERAGVNLAIALAQSPQLLILDEPTLGLDVVAKRAFMEALMYSNAAASCTVVYCSHQMEEVERLADNLIILERGRLVCMSPPDEFCDRVSHWIADVPFKGPDPETVPGFLQVQRIDGLHHYIVMDQDDGFADYLKSAGAKKAQRQPVSLDRAVNAILAKNHAAPVR